MNNFDQTAYYTGSQFVKKAGSELHVTIFDGERKPQMLVLDGYKINCVTFGRSPGNDLVLHSKYASGQHGRFAYINGQWAIEDKGFYDTEKSTNGLIYNNTSITIKALSEGDFIRIDDGIEPTPDGVLFVFSFAESENKWKKFDYDGASGISIGRDPRCNIVLPHISISKFHARIFCDNGQYYISDNGSVNGIVVNNRRISGKYPLHEKDIISITNSKLIFTKNAVYYCFRKNGISVDATNIVITRGKGKKKAVTGRNISLNIKPGELVAIIGGSGAGKSTVLNCMCGYLPPASGDVYINGINLYKNFDSIKKLIGYVPQSDIVYDNLTLYDMLSYTAKLRLPKDTSDTERETAINKAIGLVELTEKKNSFIKNLSGGQRKRASIAVELLSDPNLLFLDEPASGLDPGTERNLMQSLRQMADSGKTVILVTHSTLQLKMCDKIVFMGKGGNLCFYGSYDEALKFFGIDDIVDVYNMITDHAVEWRNRYDQTVAQAVTRQSPRKAMSAKKKDRIQLPTLCIRYMKLVLNDRKRLILLFGIAPLCALLISFVADGNQFEQYETTKSLLFALACAVSFVGILNAIQEICKERNILKREYMTGLSLWSYVFSKIIVLSGLCFVQSLLMVGIFSAAVGLPDEGVFILPFFELLFTTFFTAVASSSMGLFVSALVSDAAQANTVGVILLIPQILFSGIIFKLDGITELLSWIVVCRWGMESYGTTANLNQLQLKLQQEGILVPHEAESFFDFTSSHILTSWGILIASCIAFLVLTRLVLSSVGKEKS